MPVIRFRAGPDTRLVAAGLLEDDVAHEVALPPAVLGGDHRVAGHGKSAQPGRHGAAHGLAREPGRWSSAVRVLVMLLSRAVTMPMLKERGIRSPAQGVYDLQIAGYPVERVRVTDASEQSFVAYRLNTRTPNRGASNAGGVITSSNDGCVDR